VAVGTLHPVVNTKANIMPNKFSVNFAPFTLFSYRSFWVHQPVNRPNSLLYYTITTYSSCQVRYFLEHKLLILIYELLRNIYLNNTIALF
jgi:hypothetical protein